MSQALRYAYIWLAFCLVLSVTLLLMSEGEPVCEGPLILGVDDSFPPQCDAPIEGLVSMMPFIAFGSAVLTWLAGATAWLIRRLRPT